MPRKKTAKTVSVLFQNIETLRQELNQKNNEIDSLRKTILKQLTERIIHPPSATVEELVYCASVDNRERYHLSQHFNLTNAQIKEHYENELVRRLFTCKEIREFLFFEVRENEWNDRRDYYLRIYLGKGRGKK